MGPKNCRWENGVKMILTIAPFLFFVCTLYDDYCNKCIHKWILVDACFFFKLSPGETMWR